VRASQKRAVGSKGFPLKNIASGPLSDSLDGV
jgi:hypothetical protein